CEGVVEFGPRLAAEGLPLVAALELDGTVGLDDDRKPPGIRRRDVNACGRRLLELCAFALHAFEQAPVRKRREHIEIVRVARDRVERVVVRREDDDLTERAQDVDEPMLVRERVRREHRLAVLRPEAERARTVVHREHPHAGAAERTDRGEPVHPADIHHGGGNAHYRKAFSAATSSADGSQSPAAAFSRTCSGFVAPEMTEATAGSPSSPPTATASSETSRSSAYASSASTRSNISSVKTSSRLSSRVPGGRGSPRLYFPVNRPLASGKYGRTPRPSRAQTGSRSPSGPRCSRE